jgi:two-component system, NarL family, response regulator YdfI
MKFDMLNNKEVNCNFNDGLLSVMVVERCRLVRDAIKRTIEKFEFTKSVAVADPTSIRKFNVINMNVILLGISVVPDECLKIIDIARKQLGDIGIVVMTTNISPEVVHLLVKYGVHGILDETSTEQDLKIAIQASAHGNSFSSHYVYEKISAPKHSDVLTITELQVLSLLLKGDTNYQIAIDMCISKKTVEAHLTRIYKKIGANSRSRAIIRANELNLCQMSFKGIDEIT